MYDYGYGYSTPDYNTAAGLFGGFLAMGAIMWLTLSAACILMIISLWKIFTKAGKPGWAAIVPIYNYIVLIEIVGLPMWYIALFFVPFANFYAMFKIYVELAHKFGKTTGFGVLTIFFSFVCLPILAFSKNCIYNGNNNNQMNNNFQNPQPQNNSGMNYQNNFNNNMNNINQQPLFNQNINTDTAQIQEPQMNNINYNNQQEINQNNNNFGEQNVLTQPEINSPIETIQPIIPTTETFGSVNPINTASQMQEQKINPSINLGQNNNVVEQPQPEINQSIESVPVNNVMPTVETFGTVSPINNEHQDIQQPNTIPSTSNITENPTPVVEQQNVINNQNNTNMQ